MMDRIAGASPEPRARITGAVYLLYFLTAILGQSLASRKPAVYGEAVNLFSDACYVAVTVLFYLLFKPVNRGVSLAAALFSLVGCALTVLDLFHLAPAHVSPLLFFGPYCLLLGYLIFRSTFLPRILGVLMALAGLGWLAFLSPPLAKYLSLYLEILGVLAEGLLMLWLLVKGVNVSRWKEQVGSRKTVRA
jgi:Domain of unknown function (DUF4386)